MTHERSVTESDLSRGGLALGTTLAIALFAGMSYLVAQRYAISLRGLIWTAVFTIAVSTKFFLENRQKPTLRKRYTPGVLTINTCIIVLVTIFFLSLPDHIDFVDTVLAKLWPLVLGIMTAWLIAQLYYSVRAVSQ